MQVIEIPLIQVTGIITSEEGKPPLIQHDKVAGLKPDTTCEGETAPFIRKVTYLSQAGVQICTCSGCGGNLLMPDPEVVS